jgi:hypothetical protein
MERNIQATFWNNKKFAVEVSSANKQSRSFSFSNESPCCEHNEMGIKPYCKGCGELTGDKKPVNKLFKLGKELVRIPAEAIDAIKSKGDKSDIVLTIPPMDIAYVHEQWPDFDDWLGDSKYIEQAEKKESEHGLLKAALEGKMAFGKAKFGFAEYGIAVYTTQQGKLRMRLLVEPSQRNRQTEEKAANVSPAMVQVLRQIAEKQTMKLPELSNFAEDDSRKQLENLITRAVNGEIIAAEVIKERTDAKEADELAELQKLLETQ